MKKSIVVIWLMAFAIGPPSRGEHAGGGGNDARRRPANGAPACTVTDLAEEAWKKNEGTAQEAADRTTKDLVRIFYAFKRGDSLAQNRALVDLDRISCARRAPDDESRAVASDDERRRIRAARRFPANTAPRELCRYLRGCAASTPDAEECEIARLALVDPHPRVAGTRVHDGRLWYVDNELMQRASTRLHPPGRVPVSTVLPANPEITGAKNALVRKLRAEREKLDNPAELTRQAARLARLGFRPAAIATMRDNYKRLLDDALGANPIYFRFEWDPRSRLVMLAPTPLMESRQLGQVRSIASRQMTNGAEVSMYTDRRHPLVVPDSPQRAVEFFVVMGREEREMPSRDAGGGGLENDQAALEIMAGGFLAAVRSGVRIAAGTVAGDFLKDRATEAAVRRVSERSKTAGAWLALVTGIVGKNPRDIADALKKFESEEAPEERADERREQEQFETRANEAAAEWRVSSQYMAVAEPGNRQACRETRLRLRLDVALPELQRRIGGPPNRYFRLPDELFRWLSAWPFETRAQNPMYAGTILARLRSIYAQLDGTSDAARFNRNTFRTMMVNQADDAKLEALRRFLATARPAPAN